MNTLIFNYEKLLINIKLACTFKFYYYYITVNDALYDVQNR